MDVREMRGAARVGVLVDRDAFVDTAELAARHMRRHDGDRRRRDACYP